MKKRFLSHSRWFILPALYLAVKDNSHAATAVAGTLINVDFNGTGGRGGSTDPVTFDGNLAQNAPTAASVALEDNVPAANDFWNGFNTINQTNQPLSDSKGNITGINLSWSGFDGTYTNYQNGHDNSPLLERTDGPNGDGHLLFNAGTLRSGTVTLAGLNPNVSYNVVAIGGGSDPVKFTLGAESLNIGEWSSVVNPSTWVIFNSVIPNGAGRVIITVSSNGTNNFGIGGLQLTPVGTVSDSDGDTLPDLWEDANGLDRGNPADGAEARNALTDPDGDTLTNRTEFRNSTNPQNPDTDNDGYTDNVETKTGVWINIGNTGSDPTKRDTDGDTLADSDENPDLPRGSDPNKRDTDSDGFTDPVEIAAGTNPKDPASSLRIVVSGILVNYDFNGDAGGASPLPDPILFDGNLARNVTTAASVAFEDNRSALNDLWNGALGMDPHLALQNMPQPTRDSAGAATDVTVKWNGFSYNYTNYTNGRDGGGGFTSGPNGDGFYATRAARPTVTLGGLRQGVFYDVAAIGAGDPVKFTIGANQRILQRWESTLNPFNWTVFTGETADINGEIVLTVSSVDDASNFGIGGLQVSYAATVPQVITGVSRNASNGAITLTWTSAPGRSYTVFWSTDPGTFTASMSGAVNLPGAAGSMTRTFPAPVQGAPRLFFRVEEQ